MKLTKSQEQFVTSMGKNVLVSASAGSGKTSTMIEKLLHLIINENVNIRKLLVLTFTDAAANEMKQRLYLELSKKATEISNQLKTETNSELENKLNLIYQAIDDLTFCDIGTFHSIFKRIITKYFYLLEIDPTFSIITDEQIIILNQAITNVFNDYILKGDEDFYYLQNLFSKKRKDQPFKEKILAFYLFSKEKINFSEWFKEIINNSYNPNINENSSLIYLKNYFTNKLQYYLKTLLNYVVISDSFIAENEGFKNVSAYLNSVIASLNFISQTKSVSEFLAVLKNFSFATFTFPRKLTAEQTVFKENAQSLMKNIKEIFKDIDNSFANYNEETISKILNTSKQVALKLLEIINKVDYEYKTIKNSKSKLDFNDLQQYMLTLLNHNQALEELKGEYEYIFVDEFQDVNEIQFEIVSKISKNNNLNFIGDVKQSIYEFRLASPKIFLEQLKKFDTQNNSQVVHFNENYRSSNNILCFINYIFNALITPQTVGIDYKNTSQLICGNSELLNFDKQNKNCNVKMIVINSEKDDDESEEETDSEEESVELTKNELEAEVVVKQVLEILGKEFYNPKSKVVEKVDFKHIAILTRDSSQFVNVLTKTFEKYKIPYYSSAKTNIFNTNAIQVLFSFLKVLNNQRNDYAITTLLVSLFGNFTYNELSKIRLINNIKKVSYYNCLKQYEKEGEEPLKLKVETFFEKLNHYRQMLSYKTVYEVVVQMINDHGLLEYYKSLPNGNVTENIINEFLKLINSESFNYNLNFLVNYLTELSKKDSYTINITSGDNAVTILTMHKSKGLEWPVVILADLGKKFNTDSNDFVFSQEFGIGFPIRDVLNKVEFLTPTQMACKIEKESREIKEQIRLLYVALTRAKNYLYLVGTYNLSTLEKLQFKNILYCKNFLELIFKSFSNYELNSLINGNSNLIINDGEFGKCELQVIKGDQITTVNVKSFDENCLVNVDEEIVNKLKEILSFNYEKNTSVALKNSVSGLLGERDYENFNETTKFLSTQELYDNQTSLDIGVAYHKIMQSLNYNENLQDIELLIEKLVNLGAIDNNIKPYINSNKILEAVNKVKTLITPKSKVLKEQQFLLSDKYCNLVNSIIEQKVIIQGVIDLIIINEDCAIVIDFKTNKTKNVNYLIDSYSLQLNIYGKAVSSAYFINNVKKLLYSFEIGDFIEIK